MKIGVAAVVVLLVLFLAGSIRAGESSDKYKALEKLEHKGEVIVLVFKEQSLRKILGVLYTLGDVEEVRFAEGFQDKRVDIRIENKTVKEALIQIADENGLDYEVPSPTSLIVKNAEAKP